MIASGCKCSALPMMSGCRMCPSADPTTTVRAMTSRATTGPRSARATMAAKNVAIGAPITGMKAPRNTTAASAGASGTWRIVRPMKTNAASARAITTIPLV